jgi:hypothetical protein
MELVGLIVMAGEISIIYLPFSDLNKFSFHLQNSSSKLRDGGI